VLRGGSWSSDAENCRVSNRHYFSPDFRYYGYGFRLVRP
jgi:formylglycine-generating enzyme required for sulfatase activity